MADLSKPASPRVRGPIPPEARDSWYRQITIRFADGQEYRIPIELSATGTHLPAVRGEMPKWVRLEYHKCPCCPLAAGYGACPAALSMDATLTPLLSRRSFEKVTAIAEDGAGRRTIAEMPLQAVGAVLVQVAVMSSGCPVGDVLRPLVNDLRPFATKRELLRHLVRHVLLQQRGEVAGLRRELHRLIDPLHLVFGHLWRRLDAANTQDGDAVANALVRLDAFTMLIPYELDDALRELAQEMGWQLELPPPSTASLTPVVPVQPPAPAPVPMPAPPPAKAPAKIGGLFHRRVPPPD